MPDNPVQRRRRPWLARLLVVVLLIVGIGGGVTAVGLPRARRQQEALNEVRKLGGWSLYDCRWDAAGELERAGPPGPKWVTRLMGAGFRGTVNCVSFAGAERLPGTPNMDVFGLSHANRLTDDGLTVLGNLPDLEWLALNHTQITDAGLDHVQNLSNLRRLWLAHTQVGDEGLRHLNGLDKLEGLCLDQTRVTDAGLEHLRPLIHLRSLSLEGTQVSDAGLSQLEPLNELCTLRLDGTRCTFSGVLQLLTGPHGHSFEEALQIAGYAKSIDDGRVISLDLSATRLADDGLAQVRQLPDLQWLFLNGTQVTDAGLAHLVCLTDLTFLHLADTEITDAGLDHLANLPKLRRLHLEGTGVTEEAIGDFRKSTSGRVRIYLGGGETKVAADGVSP